MDPRASDLVNALLEHPDEKIGLVVIVRNGDVARVFAPYPCTAILVNQDNMTYRITQPESGDAGFEALVDVIANPPTDNLKEDSHADRTYPAHASQRLVA